MKKLSEYPTIISPTGEEKLAVTVLVDGVIRNRNILLSDLGLSNKGDMFIATYDTNNNGRVDTSDNSLLLGDQNSAYHLSRTNHTDSQAISTVTGLQTALDARVDLSTAQTVNGAKTFTGQNTRSGPVREPGTTLTSGSSPSATSGRYIMECNATSGSQTHTLPTPSAGIAGTKFHFIKTDSSGNTVTIAGTVNGTTNYVLSTQYKYVTVRVNAVGTAYLVEANN